MSNLPIWLDRLGKASLKPHQKTNLLRSIIIPKMFHLLQTTSVTLQTLKAADKLIRAFIRKTLHLNIHTPDACLYGSVRDGGLGFPELSKSIPFTLLKRLNNLRAKTDDLTLQSTFSTPTLSAAMTRLSRIAPAIDSYQAHRESIESSSLTKGLEQVTENEASRSWIPNPPAQWTGRDYVRVIQLRTHNLPTAALPYTPAAQRFCRGGCQKPETINHVLQSCPITHWQRIRRHDEIARKLAKFTLKKWPTEYEPHIRHTDGTLFKPDVVIHTEQLTVVADVSVNWEAQQPLAASWATKRLVYNNTKFLETARARWPNNPVTVLPLVIGSRGIWPRANEELADVLKLPQHLKRSMIHSALKWASSIHLSFMAIVWRTRLQHPRRRDNQLAPHQLGRNHLLTHN